MSAFPGKLRIVVPASVGNMGPGFDILGAAVALRNTFRFAWTKEPGIRLNVSGEGAEVLSTVSKNILCKILKRELKSSLKTRGLVVEANNEIPLGRGLGSSGTARLAGFLAAEALRGGKDLDGAAWKAALEESHPDNVMSSYKGGLVATVGPSPEYVHVWRLPDRARLVACVPDFELSTETARAILPDEVPLRDAVYNLGSIAALFAALRKNDIAALGEALEDRLHIPYRAKLVPGLDDVIAAARRSGAHGAVLSGAGPTVIALCSEEKVAEEAGKAMARAFSRNGVNANPRQLRFDNRGTQIHA